MPSQAADQNSPSAPKADRQEQRPAPRGRRPEREPAKAPEEEQPLDVPEEEEDGRQGRPLARDTIASLRRQVDSLRQENTTLKRDVESKVTDALTKVTLKPQGGEEFDKEHYETLVTRLAAEKEMLEKRLDTLHASNELNKYHLGYERRRVRELQDRLAAAEAKAAEAKAAEARVSEQKAPEQKGSKPAKAAVVDPAELAAANHALAEAKAQVSQLTTSLRAAERQRDELASQATGAADAQANLRAACERARAEARAEAEAAAKAKYETELAGYTARAAAASQECSLAAAEAVRLKETIKEADQLRATLTEENNELQKRVDEYRDKYQAALDAKKAVGKQGDKLRKYDKMVAELAAVKEELEVSRRQAAQAAQNKKKSGVGALAVVAVGLIAAVAGGAIGHFANF